MCPPAGCDGFAKTASGVGGLCSRACKARGLKLDACGLCAGDGTKAWVGPPGAAPSSSAALGFARVGWYGRSRCTDECAI